MKFTYSIVLLVSITFFSSCVDNGEENAALQRFQADSTDIATSRKETLKDSLSLLTALKDTLESDIIGDRNNLTAAQYELNVVQGSGFKGTQSEREDMLKIIADKIQEIIDKNNDHQARLIEVTEEIKNLKSRLTYYK